MATRRSTTETVRGRVADTGPGIAPEIASQLFQPFVTTKRQGMGVGLSISRTIVEAHGGRLWAEPNPGGGTIFRLTLKTSSARRRPKMSTNAVVHLIDDDEGVRQRWRSLGTAGLAVRVYEFAIAFLEALPDLQPGCIVSDVRMPGMDGLELLRRLKEHGVDLPVIIMTGHADVPLAVEAMKAGAVDFIEKPFDDEVLLSAIQSRSSATTRRGNESPRSHRSAPGCDAVRARERGSGRAAGRPSQQDDRL